MKKLDIAFVQPFSEIEILADEELLPGETNEEESDEVTEEDGEPDDDDSKR